MLVCMQVRENDEVLHVSYDILATHALVLLSIHRKNSETNKRARNKKQKRLQQKFIISKESVFKKIEFIAPKPLLICYRLLPRKKLIWPFICK